MPATAAQAHPRFGIGIVIGQPALPPPPPPPPVVVTRHWVPRVYEDRVTRVWCPPVTERRAEQVYVPATWAERVSYRWHGWHRVPVRERYIVEPAHYVTQWRDVVVTPGRWEDRVQRVEVQPGHWEDQPVAYPY